MEKEHFPEVVEILLNIENVEAQEIRKLKFSLFVITSMRDPT